MNKLALLLVATLLLPVAGAQVMIGESIARPAPSGPHGPETLMMFFNVEGHTNGAPFLVIEADNVVNFSAMNTQKKWWNATITVNVTGATSSVSSFEIHAEPLATTWHTFSVHPDGVGMVEIVLTSDTPTPQTGEPLRLGNVFAAVPPVSIRWVDPQPESPTVTEDGITYTRGGFGSSEHETAVMRLPPGGTFVPRIEVRNLGQAAVPAFKLELRGERGSLGTESIAPLEAGERRLIEFAPYTAANEQGRSYPGMQMSFPLQVTATHTIGSGTASVHPASFRLENGAVVDVRPASARIEIRSGLGAELLLPESLTLGVPTRLRYNVTNYATTEQSGTFVLALNTPGGLHYDVQGPETKTIPIDLAPGETLTGALPFTPRVTGQWFVQAEFSLETARYGVGGGQLLVPSPVSLKLDQTTNPVYLRIGEPLRVDVTIASTETLADASFGLASMAQSYFRPSDRVGEVRPGLAHELAKATSAGTSNLGTLRPGGLVNTSFEIVAKASGRYAVTPYVLAGGFAYTNVPAEPKDGMPHESMSFMGPYGMDAAVLNLAVQPRQISSAWAIAPLAAGLLAFVGAWTMRTRFVK